MKKKPRTSARPSTRKKRQSNRIAASPASNSAWLTDTVFQGIVENSNDAFALMDLRGKLLYRSPMAKIISGTSDPEVLQTDMFTRIWPEDLPVARKCFLEMQKEPAKKVPFHLRLKTKGGKPQWVEGTGILRRIKSGPDCVVIHYRDATKTREAAAALEESERRYRSLFENAGLAIFQSTLEGKVIRVNNEFARMFGYLSPEDVLQSVHDVGKDLFADPSRRLEILRLRKMDPSLSTFESRYRRKDGGTFWGRLNVRSVSDAGGKILYLEGFIEDITKNREAEQALRESEERYRNLFQNSLEGIGLSKGNTIVDANKTLLDIYGYDDLSEFVKLPLINTIAPAQRDLIRELMEKVRNGEPQDIQFTSQILRKDGTIRDVEISLGHFRIKDDIYTLSTWRDITEIKQIDERLREKEERFRATFENANVGVCIVGLDGRLLQVNRQMSEMFGYGREEMERMTVNTIAHPEDKDLSPTFMQQAISGETEQGGFDKRYIRKDGQILWGHVSSTLVRDAQGKPLYFISHVQDITKRKQAEEALRSANERLNHLLTSTSVAIYTSKTSGDYGATSITANVKQIMGYEPSEFTENSAFWIDHVHPEDRPRILDEALRLFEQKRYSYEYRFLHKDGAYRWIRDEMTLIEDHALQPVEIVGYWMDITDRKRTEDSFMRQAEELRQRNLELTRLSALTDRRMQRLMAMRAIDMAISGSLQLGLVLDILLGQLEDQLGIDASEVLLFEPVMQAFEFCAGRGFNSLRPPQPSLRMTECYAGRAAQERRLIKITRLQPDADLMRFCPNIAKEGFVSYACIPLIAKGQIKGALELFQRKDFELDQEEESFLEMLAGQAAIAIDSAKMFENLQSSNEGLMLAYTNTLEGWARALELRDQETKGHTQRTTEMTVRLAQLMGVNESELIHIHRGALLHDIGKMGIPDAILLKPGPLTEEEWTVMRTHPQLAFDMLASIAYLRPALDIPYCHHEKWDGSGYPRKLREEQIPLAARIFAVADVWDALRSDRPYRKAWTDSDAREYILRQTGKHFDPAVVKKYIEIIDHP